MQHYIMYEPVVMIMTMRNPDWIEKGKNIDFMMSTAETMVALIKGIEREGEEKKKETNWKLIATRPFSPIFVLFHAQWNGP